MKTEVKTIIVPLFDIACDEQGMVTDVIQTGEAEETITELFADEGKRFVRISDGRCVGEHIKLGTEDSIENYIEE